jgi:hypothetical protein
MTCCCAKPARFLLRDPTSTHDLTTEDHMQRLNARRTENSEGWAVRAHIGASPLLQKQSKFSSAFTEVRLICGSAGHVLEPVWENFLRNLIRTPATLNNQALLLPQCTVAGWSNLTCAPLLFGVESQGAFTVGLVAVEVGTYKGGSGYAVGLTRR